MKVGSVVIGSNFGDEGKGVITDFEARRIGAKLVSRFNGGAQAGHTVHDGDRSHVFGHVSAGTFAGADTYLSSKFLVNPLLLVKELERLKALGEAPTIVAHPEARVSTIYDMLLNGLAELARGAKRHGSCGLGINETVTRDAADFELRLKHIHRPGFLTRLRRIKEDWVPMRMTQVMDGLDVTTDEVREQFSNMMSILNQPVEVHAEILKNKAKGIHEGVPTLLEDQNVVFEGAQGLALDEFMGEFPHVTRSMTGMPYALLAAAELGIKTLQPVYVTRAYLTRHGAGPLKNEGATFGAKNVVDETNIPNVWQGALRFAPLDLAMLDNMIWEDINRSKTMAQALGIVVQSPTIAITCLDQMSSEIWVKDPDGVTRRFDHQQFLQRIQSVLSLKVSHLSYGPASTNVKYFGP